MTKPTDTEKLREFNTKVQEIERVYREIVARHGYDFPEREGAPNLAEEVLEALNALPRAPGTDPQALTAAYMMGNADTPDTVPEGSVCVSIRALLDDCHFDNTGEGAYYARGRLQEILERE